ncbi:uncharacterized protein LOC126736504 isoform X2 [Anthonomus grandis grandis]|uniref:uncharacterized protein LOC126736504 isoform X2 n=1 Tax=Anthonomus grandis grandis TaxID=2921223 RepID=UPI0021652D3A|nr:uncharacterized protein LOC126736504 isoform X2 [Anthonomus grandis grandis]
MTKLEREQKFFLKDLTEEISESNVNMITVRVNSDDSLLSGIKTNVDPTESDASLEAYHARQTLLKGRNSTIHFHDEDNVMEYPQQALYSEEECQHEHMDETSGMQGTFQSNMLFDEDDECTTYLDHISFAKKFVENVVEQSEAKTKKKLSPRSLPVRFSSDEQIYVQNRDEPVFTTYHESEQFEYVETKKSDIKWPTVDSFTVELGAYAIDEYLSYFETEEDWMYVIYYQGVQDSHCSNLYKYQAIYSLPTWKYPVAQATASLYFTIEVCRAKPSYCPVDVTFKYETYRQAHRPGHSDFNEKWLHYILDSKIKFFQIVTY